MAKNDLQNPGEKPDKPGSAYQEVGERGGKVKNPVTIQTDKNTGHLPPTRDEDRKWTPVPSKKRSSK